MYSLNLSAVAIPLRINDCAVRLTVSSEPGAVSTVLRPSSPSP